MEPTTIIPSPGEVAFERTLAKDGSMIEVVGINDSDSDSNYQLAVGTGPEATPGMSSDNSMHDVETEDPIVVVGMACRLPGGIRSPSDLWKFLMDKKTGQCKVPKERFNIDGFYHPEGDRAGVLDADGGYFLQEDVRQFENSFFNINNLEATYMDPQQRKLLEVVYECFESAGASLEDISGANIGCYVGNFTVDYQVMQMRDPDYLFRYSATGLASAILANRINHVFNLHGPTFILDTACSSSIFGLHNAVSALEKGECDGAIVAAANLITTPEQHLGTSRGGVLSATSTCHTFDASADGYGRGEGVSALYVKRLSTALKDGDNIRAVVRATAINSNGKTPGISQPSSKQQEQVIRKAYAKAGLQFNDTAYVECHGTGTAIGDPMEVEGISRCFSPQRIGHPLLLGAVKTNLGHSESASGISSIIKAVLAFENGKIPATYGVTKLNPKLKLDEWKMKIVTEPESWPTPVQRASINSFGFGGANAHAILESIDSYLPGYRQQQLDKPVTDPTQTFVLPFSASSKASLEARVEDLRTRLADGSHYDLEDLAYTLANRRSRLNERGYLLARAGSLKADVSFDKLVTPKKASPTLPIAFVFTGQGAQYAGMGQELLECYPEFRNTIRDLDDVLKALPEAPAWSLEETILAPAAGSRVNEVTHSQPLCTAVQIGLVNLLRSWGVTPKAVVGHSSGEIGAAYAASLLSAEQAIVVAYYRGYAVGQGESRGAMMAVGMNAEAAQAVINEKGLQEKIVVACVNSPESVTISGSDDAINALLVELQSQKKFARKLVTGRRAYHSHMMKEIGSMYEKLTTRGLQNTPKAHVPANTPLMFSSVGTTDKDLATFSVETQNKLPATAAYWRSNLENPVQFSTALKNLASTGKYHLIELGPHAALKGPINQIRSANKIAEQDLLYSSTLMRGSSSEKCLKSLAGELSNHNQSLNFSKINVSSVRSSFSVVDNLPPYKWNYTNLLWSETRMSTELRNRQYIRHELIGSKQLAGNNIDHSWRNILKLNEIPWLVDHKLESQIVFPAAGYLAMAVEAISQLKGLREQQMDSTSFEFRNVNIETAFVVKENDTESELHTTMSARKISAAASSDIWYDFTISSVVSNESTKHCVGSIKMTTTQKPLEPSANIDIDGYETWSMSRWYKKWAYEGLNFGQHFQSLKSLSTDRERVRTDAVATTQLVQRVKMTPESSYPGTYYSMHPLTIDACLQAGILCGTAGKVDTLKAFLPVFISSCRINTPAAKISGTEATIHTSSSPTGFGTRNLNCSLKDADGNTIIDMTDARISMYTGKTEEKPDQADERNPCLRVIWKPDVFRLDEQNATALESYCEDFASGYSDDNETIGIIGALLDLVGHKNPRMRVLELGSDCECKSKRWLDILGKNGSFSRCRTWHLGNVADDGEISYAPSNGYNDKTKPDSSDSYNVLLLPDIATSQKCLSEATAAAIDLLDEQGIIIGRTSATTTNLLQNEGFQVLNQGKSIMLAIRTAKAPPVEGRDVLVLTTDASGSSLSHALKDHFSSLKGTKDVIHCALQDLPQMKISEKTVVVSLLEIERAFLATMSEAEMDLLKSFTNKINDLVWLTGAGMFNGENPDVTLSNGLSRALMLEQPSLRYTVLDVGKNILKASRSALQMTCANVVKALTELDDEDDKEFIAASGLMQVSRFIPDDGVNKLFRERSHKDFTLKKLKDASPSQLSIKKVGMFDTINFQEISELETIPPPGFVDVDVKAVSLNAKDIYVLTGKVETKTGTAGLEFSGVVKSVAPDVTDLKPGDRIVALAPNHFRTTERVPAWSCHKLKEGEDMETMPTLPVIYTTALYALDDRSHLRKGESILIHSGAGALGMASIALAQRIGATVYTTVSTEEKAQFLMKEFGLPRSHIFHSRNSSFVDGVNKMTNGRGVDVVLNSLIGDLLHASWDCIANFGRFVEVGKRDIVTAGKLDMRMFLRNATFTAFDMSELFYHDDEHYKNILRSKLQETLDLYRAGTIKAVPIARFDVSQIVQAYRHFSTKDRVGKVVISLQNPNSLVPVVPAKYATLFDPNKTYLLIGCLGGLGRSLSKWMMSRGARNFTFLGRSGCDKPSARDLVTRLEKAGASVKVVRGDVVNKEDVVAAVQACEIPIGGVVQAAMGLHEAIFSNMSNKAWHTGIQPKWRGTWNLHHALEGHDENMDFFLLTSSVSGSVGTATESNYCAANGFLDSFARWRSSIGKQTISLGLGMISEVGYLHENPEIEALLLRKGIQPLNEDEFLQVIDLALSKKYTVGGMNNDPLASAHILTGLELFGIREMMRQGFDVKNGTLQDPRTMLLSASLDADSSSENTTVVATADWSKGLPAAVAKQLASESDAPTLNAAVHKLVLKRFSNLVLIPLDKVDDAKPLGQYGMDSMIASEYRSWFWSVFKVDIPFLDILSQTNTLKMLSDFTEGELVKTIA